MGLFIGANVLFLLVILIKKISFRDIFVFVFWGFINLYSLSVYFVHKLKLYIRYTYSLAALLSNDYIVDSVLKTSALGIVVFAIGLAITKPVKESDYYVEIGNLQFYKTCYIILFPITLYLNVISNWTSGARTGIIPSLASYSRNFMTVITIILFTTKKVDFKRKVLYLLLFLIVTFESTQRTNMFIVLIAFVYNMESVRRVILIMGAGVGSLLSLGAIRNGVNAFKFMYSILGEGIFGSWGLLQAINCINLYGYSYENLFKLGNGSINFLLETLGFNSNLSSLEEIIINHGEKYYPMGGFFYLSDGYLMHPIIGPIVYTIFIFGLYRCFLKMYYSNHSPIALLCLSLLFIAVKGALKTFVAMFLFHVLVYALLSFGANGGRIKIGRKTIVVKY